jgi:hypothetical protein
MCCYCMYPAVKGGHLGTELIGEHRGADTYSCAHSVAATRTTAHRSVAVPSKIAEIGGHRNTAVTWWTPRHCSHGWGTTTLQSWWAPQHCSHRWAPQHGGNSLIGGQIARLQ